MTRGAIIAEANPGGIVPKWVDAIGHLACEIERPVHCACVIERPVRRACVVAPTAPRNTGGRPPIPAEMRTPEQQKIHDKYEARKARKGSK